MRSVGVAAQHFSADSEGKDWEVVLDFGAKSRSVQGFPVVRTMKEVNYFGDKAPTIGKGTVIQ